MSPQSLTNKPSENGSVSSSSDIWVQCVTELSRTLPGGFVSTLTDSTLEAAGSAKDASGKLIDIYRVLIAADRAPRGVSHFSRQCGPSIRRTLSTFLRKPVLIEIAAAEPQPESEPTP
jgi:hypothetical protein